MGVNNLYNFSTKLMSHKNWENRWRNIISLVTNECDYNESACILRQIIQTGILSLTDIRDNPERFFQAHRILSEVTPQFGPGFWIRFTVQYNLFAGTIVALGSDKQINELSNLQKKGKLGCFSLTERYAGVNSGLIVDTTAVWFPEHEHFILNSPNSGAYKNWISQGLVADKCIVMANLIIKDKAYGPHGFYMDFRKNGTILPGIILEDMGTKTTGNDLDNAWIHFDNVVLSKSSLLNKFADVLNNEYIKKIKDIHPIQIFGQRLFTGRVAVAQASLQFFKIIFSRTREYSDQKKTWAKYGNLNLSDIPQLKCLYLNADKELDKLIFFSNKVEFDLCEYLHLNKFPSSTLIQAIAVLKIIAVESSIKFCFQLKQEVGSYALFQSSCFGELDFLQCCKFAEGDSRILMQKLVRDRMNLHKNGYKLGDLRENLLCNQLEFHLNLLKGLEKERKWNELFEIIYELAQMICNRILETFTQLKSKL